MNQNMQPKSKKIKIKTKKEIIIAKDMVIEKDTTVSLPLKLFNIIFPKNNDSIEIYENYQEYVIFSKILGEQIIIGYDTERAKKEKNYYTFDEMKIIIDKLNKEHPEKREKMLKQLHFIIKNAELGYIQEITTY